MIKKRRYFGLSISIAQGDVRKLNKFAELLGVTRSEAVRALIRRARLRGMQLNEKELTECCGQKKAALARRR